jgi:D-apionolactonase
VSPTPTDHRLLPRVTTGPLEMLTGDSGLRWVSWHGVEVIRGIAFPVRDADWGTMPVQVTACTTDASETHLTHSIAFTVGDGAFAGALAVNAIINDVCRIDAHLTLIATRDMVVNRAGFVILHPLDGVVGHAMTIRHPDGGTHQINLTPRISPAQPARDIAGLSHQVHGVGVDIAMTGEVFEMEDQRNWSDASLKTYCRPLGLPRPYTVAAGQVIQQTLSITLTGRPTPTPVGTTVTTGTMPVIALAHQAGLSTAASFQHFPGLAVQARIDAGSDLDWLPTGAALEIIADDAAEIARIAGAGVTPRAVVAIPRAYLASHQPDEPWPQPTPADLIPPLRAAFPAARLMSGVLTNFTELNRCPPAPGGDAITFQGTAIVHAGDDASVIETLQAWPDILASAALLANGRPLHLGLCSIGMRSNPYGAAVAANPDRRRIAMAQDDPRQDLTFAAAWALGLLATLAEAGVAEVALAMPDGPLGAIGPQGPRPIYHLIRHAAGLAGHAATIRRAGGLTVVQTAVGGMAANLGTDTAVLSVTGWHLTDKMPADAAWCDRPPARITALGPTDVALWNGEMS